MNPSKHVLRNMFNMSTLSGPQSDATQSITEPSGAAGEPLRVETETPCEQCGYNLKHQLAEGTCPECGYSVAQSMRPDRLALADPDWVIGLARGFKFILGGFAFGIFMFVVMISLVASTPGVFLDMLGWAFAMPPGLVIAYGCWLLSAPEPGRASRGGGLRDAIRFCVAGTTILALIDGPVYLVSDTAAAILMFLGATLVTVAGFCAMLYGRRIALRIPEKGLAGLLRVLFYAYAICTVVMVGSVGFIIVLDRLDVSFLSNSPAMDGVFMTFFIISGITTFAAFLGLIACGGMTMVVGIWYATVLHRISRTLLAVRAG